MGGGGARRGYKGGVRLRFRVWGLGLGQGFRVWGFGSWFGVVVWGLGPGFGVWGLVTGFVAWGLGSADLVNPGVVAYRTYHLLHLRGLPKPKTLDT